MKHLLLVVSFWLTLFSPLLYADKSMDTMYIEGGHGYHLSTADGGTLLTPVFSLGIRHSFQNQAFIQLRMDTWNGGSEHAATWIGPSAGYRGNYFSNKIFTEGSLGYGYLTKADGNAPDGKGMLTGKQQFEITFGAGFYMDKRTSELGVGIAHLSNCSDICNRGDSFQPNHGKNWVRMFYGVHF